MFSFGEHFNLKSELVESGLICPKCKNRDIEYRFEGNIDRWLGKSINKDSEHYKANQNVVKCNCCGANDEDFIFKRERTTLTFERSGNEELEFSVTMRLNRGDIIGGAFKKFENELIWLQSEGNKLYKIIEEPELN